MEKLIEAIIELVSDSPPDKTEQLAESIRRVSGAQERSVAHELDRKPARKERIDQAGCGMARRQHTARRACRNADGRECGLSPGQSRTGNRARLDRPFEQIDRDPEDGTSAPSGDRRSGVATLHHEFRRLRHRFDHEGAANGRSTGASKSRCCSKPVNHTAEESPSTRSRKMKSALPAAKLFSWVDKGEEFAGGKVHAKVAVADENFCFISSANLTGHAMEKNMEAGVLIRGGAMPCICTSIWRLWKPHT